MDFANQWDVNVQYKNSAVICRYTYSTLDSIPKSEGELESNYQELGIYKICKVYQGSTIVYKARLVFNGDLLENPWGNDPYNQDYSAANNFLHDKNNEGSVFRFIHDSNTVIGVASQGLTLVKGKTYILTED